MKQKKDSWHAHKPPREQQQEGTSSPPPVNHAEAETARLLQLMPRDIAKNLSGGNNNAGEIVAALKAQAAANGNVDRADVAVFLAEITRAVPLKLAFSQPWREVRTHLAVQART